MLDRVVSTEETIAFNGQYEGPNWQALDIPEIDPKEIEAQNALYRRRKPKALRLESGAVTITPMWQKEAVRIVSPWTLTVELDGIPGRLLVPEAVLDSVLSTIITPKASRELSPEAYGIILEHALTNALQAAEKFLGYSLHILSAQKGSLGQETANLSVHPIKLKFEDKTVTTLFQGDNKAIQRLARGLDRSSLPIDSMDFSVDVQMRWAAVDLTMTELRSLSPGDIVMVDHICPESQTALAIVNGQFFVPVKATAAGYKALAAIKPIKKSEYEWCSTTTSLPRKRLVQDNSNEIPVRMFFDFAEFEIPLEEARKIVPDTAFGSRKHFDTQVNLRVEDTHIGQGQPIVIGKGVGVRITRL